jgi:hypothetical protein
MTTMTTRSGRIIKKPSEIYVPEIEDIEDDYSEDEHDSDFNSESGDIPTEDELDDDDEDDDDDEGEWETDDDTDADENGNLEGFIDDEEVSDSEAEYFA